MKMSCSKEPRSRRTIRLREMNIPDQIAMHLLYYFTKPGALEGSVVEISPIYAYYMSYR